MAINVECKSSVEARDSEVLLAADVRGWLLDIPEGAVLDAVMRDFGSQRDPDVRLVGLRATWSEVKRGS